MMVDCHRSVLLEESIQALSIVPGGVYIDGTYGRGGHTRAVLSKIGADGRLIAIDKDDAAIQHGKANFQRQANVAMWQGSYADVAMVASQQGVFGKVNGILLDLGVSSPQLDDPDRGFSFNKDGPLDMRMDRCHSKTASEWIMRATEEDMANVFKTYGEERFSKRIAKAIVAARTRAPIESTLNLAKIITEAIPFKSSHKHPATRVFQAIRIYVNQELEDLQRFLSGFLPTLVLGGRVVVISFHSLEDRLVKRCFRELECGRPLPRELPIHCSDKQFQSSFRRCGRAVKPSKQECEDNIRSRSAVMRVGEKVA